MRSLEKYVTFLRKMKRKQEAKQLEAQLKAREESPMRWERTASDEKE
jgi:hypothetical protein